MSLKVRKILCPIDFSEASLKGLQEAIKYASHFDAELCLAHIVYSGIPLSTDAAGYLSLSPELYEIPRRNAEKKFQEMTGELNERGINTSYIIGAGDPGLWRS